MQTHIPQGVAEEGSEGKDEIYKRKDTTRRQELTDFILSLRFNQMNLQTPFPYSMSVVRP